MAAPFFLLIDQVWCVLFTQDNFPSTFWLKKTAFKTIEQTVLTEKMI